MSGRVARRWIRPVGLLAAVGLALAATPLVLRQLRAAPTGAARAPGDTDLLGRISLPDVQLVNQLGQPVRLQSDLIRDRIVVMSFIFTTCATICPPIGAGFARLQTALGPRAGTEVGLISLTLDPDGDTPERLLAWGQRFGAGPAWTLLGGSQADVDRVLKSLKVYTPAKEEHAPIVLIGDGRTGEWVRTYGLAAPATLLAAVDGMVARRHAASTGGP